MSEQNVIETPPENAAAEIQRLRATKESLLTTAQTRKARIDELESELATVKTQLEAANTSLRTIKVELPLKALSKDISAIPTLFEREFSERYSLVERDGALYVAKKGETEPLTDGGLPIPLSSSGVSKLLSKPDDPDRAVWNALVIGSRASGSGATGQGQDRSGFPTPQPATKSHNKPVDATRFGLR